MAFSATNNIIIMNSILMLTHNTTFVHSLPKLHKKKNSSTIKFPFHFLNSSNIVGTDTSQLFAISGNTPTPVPEPANDTFTPTLTTSGSWADFAENMSGEWDGFGADFSKEGKPIELPESVVPEAYREWEVKVFDWQTQCPTLALPQQLSLSYKLIKLLPTVGCEADAATRYSVQERNIDLPTPENNQVSAFAYQSTGCYVAIWPVKDHGTHRILELEHCLVDPRDRKSRVRIIQVVRLENHLLELQSIRVFCEQWYGPFRNGDQLGGCAIRDSAFASTEALQSSQVVGAWQGLNAVATFQNPQTIIVQELEDDRVHNLVRDERDLRLLPKQLWCSLRQSEDGDALCEAGWLLSQDRAITSKCIFASNAELKEIRVACETRVMSQQ